MFGNECDDADDDRVQAAEELHAVLRNAIMQFFPAADVPNLSTALWSMAHGLAFLHLDGKFRPEPAHEVADRVRSSVSAIFAVHAEVTAAPRSSLAASVRDDRIP